MPSTESSVDRSHSDVGLGGGVGSPSATLARQSSIFRKSSSAEALLEDGLEARRHTYPARPPGTASAPSASAPSAGFITELNFDSAEELAYEAPPDDEIRKRGVLKKRCVAKKVYWAERFVTLTNERLLLANSEKGEIRDELRLLDITSVQHMVAPTNAKEGKVAGNSAGAVALSYLPALSRGNSHASLGEMEGIEGSAATAAVRASSGSAISDAGADSAAKAALVKAKDEGGKTADDAPGQGRPEQRLLGSRRLYRLSGMVPGKSDGSNAQDTGEDSPGGAGPGPNHEGSQRQILAPVPHEGTQRQLLGTELHSTVHAVEFENVIEVLAEVWGRTYYLKAETSEECDEWVAAIAEARAEAEAEYHRSLNPTWWARARARAKRVYVHPTTQIIIAVILFSNFIINIVETEVVSQLNAADGGEGSGERRKGVAKGTPTTGSEADGSGDSSQMPVKHPVQRIFDYIDLGYTCIYLIEMLWNLFGHWFWEFFMNAWSVFDLVVVALSIVEVVIVDLAVEAGAGVNVNVLRMLRIFRVLRIINKMKSMRRIINAIRCSIKPVASAMLLGFVVLSIYSILGVNMFAHKYPHADEYFGSYVLAFIGLLGIATGDSWTFEVRAMTSGGDLDWQVAAFFVTFILFVGIILLNVILTVLIEGFMSSIQEEEERERINAEIREHHRMAGALDPLLATLANFRSPQHLESQLEIIFLLFDVDDSGSVDFEEFKLGIQKLGYQPHITVSPEDWDVITIQGSLLDEDGALQMAGFQAAMRFQLSYYSQRLLSNKMQQHIRSESEMAPMLFALKMVMMQVMELEEGREVERLETTGQIFSPRLPRRLPEVSPSRGCSEALYLPADGEVGGGDRDGPNVMEQLRLLREMVLAEKHQAGEERRLACEERARAAEERARAAADRVRLSEQLDEMRQLLLMHASADRGGGAGHARPPGAHEARHSEDVARGSLGAKEGEGLGGGGNSGRGGEAIVATPTLDPPPLEAQAASDQPRADAIIAARHLCLQPMETGGGSTTSPSLLLSRRQVAIHTGVSGGMVANARSAQAPSPACTGKGKRLADVRQEVAQMEEKLGSLTAQLEGVTPRASAARQQVGSKGRNGSGGLNGASRLQESEGMRGHDGFGRSRIRGEGAEGGARDGGEVGADGKGEGGVVDAALDHSSGDEFVLECSDFDDVRPGDEMELALSFVGES